MVEVRTDMVNALAAGTHSRIAASKERYAMIVQESRRRERVKTETDLGLRAWGQEMRVLSMRRNFFQSHDAAVCFEDSDRDRDAHGTLRVLSSQL